MTVFNSEMHLVTFLISSFELLFFFYQIIYYLCRPNDKNRLYYLILLYLLIQYNVLSGILPDPRLSMSIVLQNIISYASAIIMAMYFPYYFYKAFKFDKLKFYAYKGSILFLLAPFILLFIIPYSITKDIELSRKFLDVIPFFYGITFLYSLNLAIKIKNQETKDIIYKKEVVAVYFGVIFWILLPVIGFFESNINIFLELLLNYKNGSQIVEVISTNSGLLIMTVLFIRYSVKQSRDEYYKLLHSEQLLLKLNTDLTIKVRERTRELELANEQKTNTLINLAHETKTPLTLLNNYINDFIKINGESEEIRIIKATADKLTRDIVNLFDLERFHRGLNFFNHNQISNFSDILDQCIYLFKPYAIQRNIELTQTITNNILVKADPEALYRIAANIIENAIKYTDSQAAEGKIAISLMLEGAKIHFIVKDNGIGIPIELQNRIFEPYYQINTKKQNFQGMGMGLAIVKELTNSIKGEIKINSKPETNPGTEIIIILSKADLKEESIAKFTNNHEIFFEDQKLDLPDEIFDEDKATILIVEDNIPLLNYLARKLQVRYNFYGASNGLEALHVLRTIKQIDLIVSDIMMDKVNGIDFYKSISSNKKLSHIPFIFISAKIGLEDKLYGLSLGAIDYIEKPFSIEEIINKIDSVLTNLNNQRIALIDQAFRLINRPESDKFKSNCIKFKLTEREIEVVMLISQGKIYKEVADSLNVSIDTVKTHIKNIFEKVKVSNKVELINKLEIQNM